VTSDQLTALTAAGESESLEFRKSTAEKDRGCRTHLRNPDTRGPSVV
jgi:hypothetical protein